MTPVTDPATLAKLNEGQPQLQAVRDPITLGKLEYGLDFNQPEKDVRAALLKLPETEQKRAQDIWAEYRVQKLRNAGFKQEPDVARGIPLIGPYLDEATALIQSGLNTVTGGYVGAPYDEALAFERARTKAAEAASPTAATLGQLAAGVATGGQLFNAITPARTLLGRMGQGVAIGAPVGAVEGYGAGEGSVANRLDKAGETAETGAWLGAAFPVATALGTRAVGAVSDAIGPTITRYRAGVEEAADDILARRIASEGSTPGQKRLDLQRGQAQAARLDSNSYAELPESIADTSDSMRRLTGSLYRQGGESGNYIRDALETRQRGLDNPYGPRATDVPQGQMERVVDATERALLIRSANSARQTERQIMMEQARRGRELYQRAYQNSEGFDIQPVLDGFALKSQQYPGPFRARLNRALNLFRDNTPQQMPVNNIQRFDASKKALDDLIEKAQRSGEGNLTRELTEFKNELLNAVHRVDGSGAPTANLTYREARQAWGSAAENREAIDLGRAALRENAEVTAEQFRELTEGQQRLFRLGFLESLRNALSSKRPGNDVTQLFQQRRVQELMNEIIPRPRSGNAVFANRGERFGDLMNREQRMVQTRNTVLGNSATQMRGQDDAAFAGDALANMWNRFRQSPSLFNMGVEAVGVGIQKVFGYRQDVALALARRLLETEPTARNQILRRLQRRTPSGFVQFADMLDRTANSLTAAGVSPMLTDESGAR
jgi:hypothetical protein